MIRSNSDLVESDLKDRFAGVLFTARSTSPGHERVRLEAFRALLEELRVFRTNNLIYLRLL